MCLGMHHRCKGESHHLGLVRGACLPEGKAPGGAKASSRFAALDPRRTDIGLPDIICRRPARYKCTSHVHGHKYRKLFAYSRSLAQYGVRRWNNIRENTRYRIGAWGTHFPGDICVCIKDRVV